MRTQSQPAPRPREVPAEEGGERAPEGPAAAPEAGEHADGAGEVGEREGELTPAEAEREEAEAEAALAERPTTDAATFRTAKGSTYIVHADGTTTRNKAARADAGHEGDFGPKARSARTVYVDDARMASALSAAGIANLGEKGARVIIKDGKASLLTWNDEAGRWGRSKTSTDIAVSEKPAVGKAPLELWKKADDVPGYEAYRGMHAGNAITEIGPATERTTAGEQTVLPGAERIPEGEQAQRAAEKPLAPKVAQKEPGGLFSDESKQTDLVDMARKGTPVERVLSALRTDPAFDDLRNHARIFGSVAAGKERPGDVDLMVDYSDRPGEPAKVPGASRLLALAREHYGSFDPYIKTADGLFVRNDEATGWTKAKNAQEIWDESQKNGKPLIGEAKPEHPGLVIKSLETGKVTHLQPPGTKKPRAFPSYTTAELQKSVDSPNTGAALKEKMRAEIEARQAGESEEKVTPQVGGAGAWEPIGKRSHRPDHLQRSARCSLLYREWRSPHRAGCSAPDAPRR